jgi:archaellum component FlaC
MPPPDGERAFAVVVEQLRGEFKVFGTALGGLRQEMNERFADVKSDMGDLKQDLADVKSDMGDLKQDLAEVKVDVNLLKTAATTHGRELKEIRSALGNKVERGEVEAIVEHVVARSAQR